MSRRRSRFPWPLSILAVAVVAGTAFFPLREDGEVRFLVQVVRARLIGRADAVYSGLPSAPGATVEPRPAAGPQTAR